MKNHTMSFKKEQVIYIELNKMFIKVIKLNKNN